MPIFTGGGSSVTSANIVDGEIINADIAAAAAIAPTKLDLLTALSNGGDLVTGIQTITVTLNSADIIAISNTTSRTVIAAPGAGKVILVDEWDFFYDYNSVAFTGGTDWNLYYGATAVTCGSGVMPQARLNAAADSFTFLPCATVTDVTTGINTAVVIKAAAAASFAAGNGSAKIFVRYRIITY